MKTKPQKQPLYVLSCGPDACVSSYSRYIVNNVKFLVKIREDRQKTQNYSVTVAETHGGIEDDYYGYLDDIIELSYIKNYRVILFKYKWFDTDQHRKYVLYEPHGISINTSHVTKRIKKNLSFLQLMRNKCFM